MPAHHPCSCSVEPTIESGGKVPAKLSSFYYAYVYVLHDYGFGGEIVIILLLQKLSDYKSMYISSCVFPDEGTLAKELRKQRLGLILTAVESAVTAQSCL